MSEPIYLRVVHKPETWSDGIRSGCREHTRIYDQHGRELRGVQSVKFEDDVNGRALLTVTILGTELEVEADVIPTIIEGNSGH